jgi:hypothetical protein
LQSLDYAPTSMTVGCGYLASGGQQSELTVTKLEDNGYENAYSLPDPVRLDLRVTPMVIVDRLSICTLFIFSVKM